MVCFHYVFQILHCKFSFKQTRRSRKTSIKVSLQSRQILTLEFPAGAQHFADLKGSQEEFRQAAFYMALMDRSLGWMFSKVVFPVTLWELSWELPYPSEGWQLLLQEVTLTKVLSNKTRESTGYAQHWILHKPEVFSLAPWLDCSNTAESCEEDHNHEQCR